MTKMEWINLIGLLAILAGGSLYIGNLNGRLQAVESGHISEDVEKAKASALEEIGRASESFHNLEKLVTKTYEWKWKSGNQEETEMIKKDEGICYLVSVTGYFRGWGEEVYVRPRGGYWFLGGKSKQAALGAKAQCWKFPTLTSTRGEEK